MALQDGDRVALAVTDALTEPAVHAVRSAPQSS
jgi:hypothetical protein